jgi:hypothetical protein
MAIRKAASPRKNEEGSGDQDDDTKIEQRWRHNIARIAEKSMYGEALISPFSKFGYQYFGPLLLDWYNRLNNAEIARDAETIYCLGREGWSLVSFFSAVENLRGAPRRRYVYLHASRALLTHLSLSDERLANIGFSSRFDGTIRHFFQARLGLSEDLIGLSGGGDRRIILPRDHDYVSHLFAGKEALARPFAERARAVYGDYLRGRGLHGDRRFVLADLGFRGTTQALLSDLYDLDLVGVYAMLDPGGVPPPLTLKPGSAIGLFSDDWSFGQGYAPMDGSLLFEAFLTAPFGQVVGVQDGVDGDPFLYRPGGSAQANFGIIADCMQGALKFSYDHEDLVGSESAIISDFELFFESFSNAIKRNIAAFEPILELDDSYFGSPSFDARLKL